LGYRIGGIGFGLGGLQAIEIAGIAGSWSAKTGAVKIVLAGP
jgi:hypothetical protein